MFRRGREYFRRIARIGISAQKPAQERQAQHSLPELQASRPPAILPGPRMTPEAEAKYLEECREAELDPNDPTTFDRLEEFRLQRSCEARGLNPNSPDVQDDLNRLFLEELSKDE